MIFYIINQYHVKSHVMLMLSFPGMVLGMASPASHWVVNNFKVVFFALNAQCTQQLTFSVCVYVCVMGTSPLPLCHECSQTLSVLMTDLMTLDRLLLSM